MAKVIRIFDGASTRYRCEGPRRQTIDGKAKVVAFHGNQYTRRSCISMLLCGGTFRAVARKHPGKEKGLLQEVREAILGGGRAA